MPRQAVPVHDPVFLVRAHGGHDVNVATIRVVAGHGRRRSWLAVLPFWLPRRARWYALVEVAQPLQPLFGERYVLTDAGREEVRLEW